jgi:periplasmic protein CpxP/Spy
MENKTKIFTLTLIGLMLSNLLLIGFLFFRPKPHPPKGEGPKGLIIEKLQFSEEQIVQYSQLIGEHRKIVSQKEQALKEAKLRYYQTLNSGNSELALENLLQVQEEMEIIHFNHFNDIKSICNQNQLQNFEDLVNELPRMFGPPKHRSRQ